jgi:uncharacterized protein YndB with AHSA1/START domain
VRLTRHIDAPRAAVYEALVDPEAVRRWRVPDGMTSEVHEFEPREGGAIRVSLSYDAAGATGKTSARTDTYRGRFVELAPGERVVEAVEFETAEESLQGEMRITTTLSDATGGGTTLTLEHEGLPRGVRAQDNELGTRMSLDKLAALVEAGYSARRNTSA